MMQVLANGLFHSSIILLVALGFSLIYGVTRFFHLGHGAVFAIGGYCTYYLLLLPVNLVTALLLTSMLGALVGMTMEILVYKRLRRYGAPNLVYLISSLGMLLVLQNSLGLLFGNEIRAFPVTRLMSDSIMVLGAVFTKGQLLIMGTTVALTLFLISFMKTKTGLFIRALSDNPFVAKALGMDYDRMMLLVFGVGSALAAIAGGLMGQEKTIFPSMGFSGTLYAMLACILGGIGSLSGTILGSILIGMVQSVSVACMPPEWKDSVALGIVLVVLLFRPYGIIARE